MEDTSERLDVATPSPEARAPKTVRIWFERVGTRDGSAGVERPHAELSGIWTGRDLDTVNRELQSAYRRLRYQLRHPESSLNQPKKETV